MKLSWKIFLSTLVIMILTFSIGGYYLISAVFNSAYERESQLVLEENKIFLSYFSAIIPTARSESQVKNAMLNISESIVYHFTNEELSIRISDQDRNEIVQSGEVEFVGNLLEQKLEDNVLVYETMSYEDSYYIQTALTFQTLFGRVYLETVYDITSIFTDRQNLFSFYRKLIFFMLVINGLLVFLMTLWTMFPLRKLSKATREIAKGSYGNRVNVKSKDEIGLLAEDFNLMAESLETKIHDLEATTISQRDFIASFAHEIKTPLTSIIGYADMLRSKKMSEENRILAADYIFGEGKRLESLSSKLMDLVVVKNHDFKTEQYNMKELFRSIEETMEPILKESNIALSTSAEDVEIRLEPDLMKILVINLMDNARKAIQESGIIKLIGKRISDDGFMIIVEDNGKGISDKELSRITEIFYTVDKSRFRGKGVGIGLSLCKEIVELNGGEMVFESQIGVGTKVYLYLKG